MIKGKGRSYFRFALVTAGTSISLSGALNMFSEKMPEARQERMEVVVDELDDLSAGFSPAEEEVVAELAAGEVDLEALQSEQGMESELGKIATASLYVQELNTLNETKELDLNERQFALALFAGFLTLTYAVNWLNKSTNGALYSSVKSAARKPFELDSAVQDQLPDQV